ncbi:MAG TPA: alpha-2-macroglobulin family protein, partial [Thermomicrobiaceae bacterium]|nr:alpha-2-macroglobulin family protein [Thermomicrobiaceae bacterium]
LGQRQGEAQLRVERYVLPKYEVTLQPAKSWVLAGEPLKGTVSAEYSFGKPVVGEVELVAARYVGDWQEYARLTKPLDGKLAFELPPVGYAAGVPAADGLAQVRLDVTVREQATGYAEQDSQLVSVAAQPVGLRLIPESVTFKPGLPFSLLLLAETPDKQPVDTEVELEIDWERDGAGSKSDSQRVTTRNGLATLSLTPPKGAILLHVLASAEQASAVPLLVQASYSPSGAFIHLSQANQGALKVGDAARFQVATTRETSHVYYEVTARGGVVASGVAQPPEIALPLTPLMAPEARLVVYQLLPGSVELAADYLPFSVSGDYPQAVTLSPEKDEVKPGDNLTLRVGTEGPARVGLAAVDRAVFILAENRLNLQQVFDALEQLYQKPQIELHAADSLGDSGDAGVAPVPQPAGGAPPAALPPIVAPVAAPTVMPGAKELFDYAGLTVLTNRTLPAGKPLASAADERKIIAGAAESVAGASAATAASQPAAVPAAAATPVTPEPPRLRQFFPETWLWETFDSDGSGRASRGVTAPDSITTWQLRAVALSKEHGLGVGEAELRVFQPFFVQVDLPFSVTRGEEFPVKLALYNYLGQSQQISVTLENAAWFDLLGVAQQTVTVPANSVGAVSIPIRPTALGTHGLKVTARGQQAADAIEKELLVEAEGVARELAENLVLAAGSTRQITRDVPPEAVPGSATVTLAVTGNVLSQTMDGLDSLLRMPFGCGEQNMILFAPNVFVTQYLKATAQLKTEVLAKADVMMLTGYQRELTYRRDDGSFSAFGQQDPSGSLWLTAFVLKTFAQARGLLYIDDGVLAQARDWIRGHQQADGSFDPVGFIHHQELLGGLKGTPALTAFVAVALREAGDDATAARAQQYLERALPTLNDPYGLALTTYALALGQSGRAGAARDKLMALAHESEEGLYWGDKPVALPAAASYPAPPAGIPPVETTAYAALALLALGDNLNAGRAVRWLAAQRNPQGGFGTTQDTVVALQAMTSAAVAGRAEIDATVTLSAGSWRKELRLTPESADVMQLIELPLDQPESAVALAVQGKGQVQGQVVRRFNLPSAAPAAQSAFQIEVRYDADEVAVDDLLAIEATVTFTPPEPIAAGMTVLDLALPTGFSAETSSLQDLQAREPRLKRFDLAGRKVIFYIEDMRPGETLTLSFQARALFPVKAQAGQSQAYAYYRPEWRGEALAGALSVRAS